jgi:5,10-methylenetetrahydrofolate reductase
VEVIVTDPQADARFWAEALNLGAYDLLTQPFYEPEVRRILYNACSRPWHQPILEALAS